MITKLRTVMVYVNDQDQALRFYTEKLGFELRSDRQTAPQIRWLVVAPPGAESGVALYPRAATKDWAQRRASVAFSCANTRATCEALAKKGVTIKKSPQQMPWGSTLAILADPDGNEFVLSDAA